MRAKRRPPIERASTADRTMDGIVFDSKTEGRRWLYLCKLVSLGAYRTVRRQVRVQLGEDFSYTADFYVEARDGIEWYEDVKGYKRGAKGGFSYYSLPSWGTAKRLWPKYGPAPLLVTVWHKGHWHVAKTILCGGRAE